MIAALAAAPEPATAGTAADPIVEAVLGIAERTGLAFVGPVDDADPSPKAFTATDATGSVWNLPLRTDDTDDALVWVVGTRTGRSPRPTVVLGVLDWTIQ